MKKNSACWLAFLIGVLFTLSSSAQTTQANYFIPTFYPRAPNTASIEKFGSYNVNLFTGLPDISIPLYSIDAGGVQFPITLSYHASGIRVSEVASWVGLGWSLSAGGVISRNIIGKADDGIQGYLQGYLKNTAALAGHTDNNIDSINYYNLGIYDSRPDIFSYSFPGHGGKFFLDGTSAFTPRFVPFAPIKVTNNYVNSGNPTMTTFNVTDEHGNKYTFGDQYLERTYTSTQSTPSVAATSGWPLETMITQNKRDTVRFTYSQQTVYQPDVVSNTDVVDDQVVSPQNFYTFGYKQGPQNISSAYVNEQLLQHIYFKNGRIDFELETTARADLATSGAYSLKNISVYIYNYGTKAMELQKRIRFYTSYFNPTISNAKRLKLDSIQVLDKAGSIAQHYSFDYNTAIALPYYGSLARDYWGFYNNKPNNSLTPNMTIQVSRYGGMENMTIGSTVPNSRYSDSTYMQAGVLTGIHYPTGGYSTFTYQTNQYWDNASSSLMQAGGLHVKSISSYDGVNPSPILKTYVYNNYTARKNYILENVFFATQIKRQNWSHAVNNGDSPNMTDWETERTFVSNPRIDIEPWDAATVVYPQVTEYTGTPTANVGKTEYLFRDLNDTQNIGSMTGTPIINSVFYARGQLIKKSEYLRKSDGSYQIVKVDSSSYTAFAATTYPNVGLTVGKTIANEGIDLVAHLGNVSGSQALDVNGYVLANYGITSDDNYLTGTLTRLYDYNDPTKYTVTKTDYKYGSQVHQQVVRVRHTDSKGVTKVTVNKYPADYTAGNTVLDNMLANNMQADLVEKYDSVKNVATGVSGVSGGQLNIYSNTIGANGAILVNAIKTLAVGAPVTNFTPSAVSGGTFSGDSRYVQMISFDTYDSKNNVSQYTPRNAAPVSVFWDYQQSLPVAQIQNALVTKVAYTGFEADGGNNWVYNMSGTLFDATAPSGSRTYPLTAGQISTAVIDFTKNNIVSYWSNGGPASVYFNGYITGTGLKSTAGGWTYYEHLVPAGSAASLLISGTQSIDELRLYPADAQMTTYTYDPNGVVLMEDTKGMVSRFEYDYSQRLRNIKDWNGNIVKNFGYHYYDMTVGNDAMLNVSFTRNNCPAGTTPQSTTYSVAANTYYSSTKASANASASYDLNINGQIKANNPAICGCPIQTISFTFSNTTGLNGYQASFSGPSSFYFNVPSSGTSTVQVPVGTYTLSINPVGTFVKNFKLGNRTPINGHNATFTSVNISTGTTDNSLSIY
ncbi:DUF5977 domain-containing protein [Mucilaginibacter psychrotolerans]|uniref:DUF5977 domain-containing protein n=1 Tax=Mucilaginibacter psychrotolerans TaxID=1524096 RepID=A0A4Y8SC87_9SPHI|nr:DUF5977 domain-containing protein [Mucilaginibacter psychrotolerans]TFF36207.1 hypothetical protein E2R66_16840 [Mucilaginibacter psychrotolerans]